jgi:hypothetical protein
MPMRKFTFLFTALCVLLLAGVAQAQQDKSQRPSPTLSASSHLGETKIVVTYGSPAVKGRPIWGKLVPYDKIWRTGANEATTLEVSTDVMIEGQLLPAGRYAIFTVPGEESWTFIFNKDVDQWGAYNYDDNKDALRVEATPAQNGEFSERLSFVVIPDGDKEASVTLFWEKIAVGFKVSPTE